MMLSAALPKLKFTYQNQKRIMAFFHEDQKENRISRVAGDFAKMAACGVMAVALVSLVCLIFIVTAGVGRYVPSCQMVSEPSRVAYFSRATAACTEQ